MNCSLFLLNTVVLIQPDEEMQLGISSGGINSVYGSNF